MKPKPITVNNNSNQKTFEIFTPFPHPFTLGYIGNRSRVAFYWEPGGDELALFDGQFLTCGTLDNWLFIGWMRENGLLWADLQVGDSETNGVNCILVDMKTNQITVENRNETFRALRDSYIAGIDSAMPTQYRRITSQSLKDLHPIQGGK